MLSSLGFLLVTCDRPSIAVVKKNKSQEGRRRDRKFGNIAKPKSPEEKSKGKKEKLRRRKLARREKHIKMVTENHRIKLLLEQAIEMRRIIKSLQEEILERECDYCTQRMKRLMTPAPNFDKVCPQKKRIVSKPPVEPKGVEWLRRFRIPHPELFRESFELSKDGFMWYQKDLPTNRFPMTFFYNSLLKICGGKKFASTKYEYHRTAVMVLQLKEEDQKIWKKGLKACKSYVSLYGGATNSQIVAVGSRNELENTTQVGLPRSEKSDVAILSEISAKPSIIPIVSAKGLSVKPKDVPSPKVKYDASLHNRYVRVKPTTVDPVKVEKEVVPTIVQQGAGEGSNYFRFEIGESGVSWTVRSKEQAALYGFIPRHWIPVEDNIVQILCKRSGVTIRDLCSGLIVFKTADFKVS